MQDCELTLPSRWARSKHPLHSAFSLLELMAVVAIVGVLSTILLPAVEAAREAARRSQCSGHLRQLGLAAHLFHEVHGRLPPGFLGPDPPVDTDRVRDQSLGVLAYLLPHFEDTAAFDQIAVELDVHRTAAPWWRDDATWRVAQNRVALFVCPSANPYQTSRVNCLMHTYCDRAQNKLVLQWFYFTEDNNTKLGRTNYLGCAGYMGVTGHLGADRLRGIFTNRSHNKFAQVTDGTSHTLLFGEVLSFGNDQGERWYGHSWVGSGALPVAWGIADESPAGFGSRHPVVVQFCFVDGSVRALSKDIEQSVLNAFAGICDGGVVDATLTN